MPADLFDPASRPSPAASSRRLTVVTSIALHIAAAVVFILPPLAGSVPLPAVMAHIEDYVIAAALPAPPPAPQAPVPARPAAVDANPAAAPIEAPRSIEAEVETPVPGVRYAQGGLPISGSPGVPGGLPADGHVALAAPAPPAPPAPVPVGGRIRPPRRLAYVPPVYPAIAQTARVEGTVILEAIISESGEVTAVKVLRSVPLLDEAARAAVARWRYSPTTLNGVTVPVIMTVTVTFSLK